MKAKDIMSVDVITATPDDDIDSAARLMLEHAISGLPVVASDGVLMGIVSEGDLLGRVELRRASAWLEKPVLGPGGALDDYVKAHGQTVGDVMSRDVVSADVDTTVEEIAGLMARHHVKRIVILRGERVAGIVSRADLIRGLVTAREEAAQVTTGDMRRTILNRLHVELGLPRGETGATVRGDKIILWGSVETEDELRAARVAAESVAGREAVVSYMRIESGRPARV